MMRGKSPPSELIVKIIKSNNSLIFFKEFEKGDNFIIVKILLCLIPQIYFYKKGKNQQNKSLHFMNFQICHLYTSL